MERQAIADLQSLAADQHGLFTCGQAREVDVSPWALRQAEGRGWLRSVRRGVYAFAGRAPSRWEQVLAASLAAGPAAIISHRAAAAIHGFWGISDSSPELTIRGSAGRSMEGVRIHRSIGLGHDDVIDRRGVQITSPVRTLIDLAPTTNDYLLPRIVDEGTISKLWTAERIANRLAEYSGGPRGMRRLGNLLAERMEEANPDSPLEQRVIRVMKPWLPPFKVHYRIELAGRIVELDVAWPEHLIGAEVDGRSVRVASRTKFDSDRVRSNLLETCGWRVIHLTSTMDDLTLLAQLIPLFPAELIDWRIRSDVAKLAPPSRRG